MSIRSNIAVAALLSCSAVLLLTACGEGQNIEQTGSSSKKPSQSKLQHDEDLVENGKGKTGVEEEEPGEISYPKLQFNGQGYTTYKTSDRFPMTSTIATELTTGTLSLTTISSKVNCAPKCDQGEVDRDIAAKLGTSVYQRVAKKELNRLKNEEKFKYASFAVFAGSAQKAAGNSFQFESPLPVFPWPAAMSRYDELEDGPQEWTSRVNGQFTATVSVSLQGKSGDEVTIKFDLTIMEDQKHELYGEFPMPKSATYVINTKTRDVLRIDSTSAYKGNKSKMGEFSVQGFGLCSKTKDGKTETFSCP